MLWLHTGSLGHLFSPLLTWSGLRGIQLYSPGHGAVPQLVVPALGRLGEHGIRVGREGQGLSLSVAPRFGITPADCQSCLGTLLLLPLIFPLCHLILERLPILKLVKTSKQKILLIIWLDRHFYPLPYSYCCLTQGHGVLAAPRWADRQDYSLDLPQISLFMLY